MKKLLFLILLGFAGFSTKTNAQTTFTFVCKCDYLYLDSLDCDICTPTLQSRFFKGILIYRNGIAYKWIESPYTIKFTGQTARFQELIYPNPETINIDRSQTIYGTLDSFKMALDCPCAGNLSEIAVDTPIIGDGSPGNPITIGQFGANVGDVLVWNGTHWLPGTPASCGICPDSLPYYTGDTEAMANGLSQGDPYLLACDNDYVLPAGIFKVVKICGFDCSSALLYFRNDTYALAGGIPYGNEYVLDEDNYFGILYGFLKVVTTDTIEGGTLLCNTVLPEYPNDVSALIAGASFGDLYTMTQPNTYGAPWGQERALSSTSSTMADPPNCCDPTDRLPFYDNDADAIAGGLSSGYYYYLDSTNTLGFPYGTKKKVI